MPTPASPQRGGNLVVVATTLLTGLATGALCCLLALAAMLDPVWLLPPLALAIGVFMRWQGYRATRGAIAAATATLICLLYTEYLYAAVRMADMLGFALRDTLFKMDWPLAWQIVASNFRAGEVVVFLIAPLLAAAITQEWPRGRNR